jgi:hypothetical protein
VAREETTIFKWRSYTFSGAVDARTNHVRIGPQFKKIIRQKGGIL